jgi:hypothetical protein
MERIIELGTTLEAINRLSYYFFALYLTHCTVIFGPSSRILSTLTMEAMSFFETSVLTEATRRHIPDDSIFPSHRRKASNLTHDPMFQKNWVLLQGSKVHNIASQRASVVTYCQRCSYLVDYFHHDDGGYTFLRNDSFYKYHTA